MKKKEILVHIASWSIVASLMFFLQTNVYSTGDALLHASRALVAQMLAFYINLYFLLPRFYSKKRYFNYSFSVIAVLLIALGYFSLTNRLLPRPSMHLMAKPIPQIDDSIRFEPNRQGVPFKMKRSPNSQEFDTKDPFRWERFSFITVFNTIPFLFLSVLIWIDIDNRKRKQQEITLKNENLLSEMRFLKSQINPHFLFNALNNIYSLAFTKSENTPHMIMKLSDMLRHVVYNSSSVVQLSKEVTYIKNYIDFQILKLGSSENIQFDFEKANQTLSLEPMLLIPFIENAFKHSDIDSNPNGYISIELSTDGKSIELMVQNSFAKAYHTKDHTPGIGLQNVQQRLNLAYPGRSSVTYKSENETFTVNLNLITHA